jgi:hypothetical protein
MPFAYSRVPIRAGELLLGLQDTGPATDEQWAPLMRDVRVAHAGLSNKSEIFGLVVSDGGAPNAGQRAEFARNLNGRPFKCGVLSDSTLVRGAVTAMSWFNSGMKSFSPKESGLWLDYVPLEATELLVVRRTIAELYGKVNVSTLQTLPALLEGV